jgi:hypothetical protein
MLWVLFAFMMAMMWSRHWGGDWSGRSRGRHGLKAYDQRIEALEAEAAGREDTIALLETRVAELESRLDFTERLMLQSKSASGEQALA